MKHIAAVLLFLGGAPAIATTGGLTYTVTAETRARIEHRDNRDFSDTVDDERTEVLGRLRLGVSVKHAAAGLSAFVQSQTTGDHLYLPGDDTSGDSTALRQFYAEWSPLTRKEWLVRAGRQELAFGAERLVGALNWTNMARSWDALRADYSLRDWKVSAFGGRLGWAAPVPTTPGLYGLYAARKPDKTTTLDVYALYKRDEPAAGDIDVFTLGSRCARSLRAGWDWSAEAAYQFGDNKGRDISAWAASASGGRTFDTTWKPRAFVEVNAASGSSPTSASHGTFDTLFPTGHGKYGNMDYQGWQNTINIHLGVAAKPGDPLTLNADFFLYRLEDSRDAWYNAGGAANKGAGGKVLQDPTGAAGRSVGSEIDLQATWAVNKSLTVLGGYSRFFPGSFIERVNGAADGSDWLFVQATWKH